ncbi:MAG: hypothetical protein V4574_14850 [Pseudomonadota bacterium]
MNRPSLIALAAALALAGCNKAPETTDNAMVNLGDAADLNSAAFNSEAPIIEDANDDPPAVAVVAVPKAVSGATVAETAPLTEAEAIEEDIRAGRDIQRVRYGDGWAWTRGGRILRTADREGRAVAYFRGGEDRPFFVQREGRAYAYQGDKPTRVWGTDGKVREPDSDRARDAADAARDARTQREHAEQARDHARSRGDVERGPRRPEATATPTPTPTASPTPRGRDRDRRRGMSPEATPSPQAGRDRRDRDN